MIWLFSMIHSIFSLQKLNKAAKKCTNNTNSNSLTKLMRYIQQVRELLGCHHQNIQCGVCSIKLDLPITFIYFFQNAQYPFRKLIKLSKLLLIRATNSIYILTINNISCHLSCFPRAIPIQEFLQACNTYSAYTFNCMCVRSILTTYTITFIPTTTLLFQ